MNMGKAKIAPEHLDDILIGLKSVEIRSLETITLTDGKREHTFKINNVVTPDKESWHCMEYLLKHTFPRYLDKKAPVVFLELGEEVKSK